MSSIGKIINPADRVGQVGTNNYGSKMTVIEYKDYQNVTVRFEDGYVATGTWQQFQRGAIKSVYDRSVSGVGYIGEGDNINPEVYKHWRGMLTRCYDDGTKERQKSYTSCVVDSEWHNYQNFANWYKTNVYFVGNDRLELDKDLLGKGSKVYSKDTCLLLPSRINKLLITNESRRGDLPVGVVRHHGKFIAQVRVNGTKKWLGTFDTPEEASKAYVLGKEEEVKRFAHEYRDVIPTKVFEALMNYKLLSF